jgi:hypothetical protein
VIDKKFELETELKTLLRLADSSKAWFRSKRPFMYSLEQHLEHPTINCVTEREKELAKAVANWIKKGG